MGGCVCGWEEGGGGPVQLREAEQKENKAAGRWREKIGKQDGESRCEMDRDEAQRGGEGKHSALFARSRSAP